MKQRIVYLERDSVIANIRRPGFAHDWVEYQSTRPELVVERLQGCTIAIINKVPLPAVAVDALSELKMIAVAATGTNCIDLEACRRRGIVVSNIQGYAEQTVPEHVFSLLLALSRNLIAWRESLLAGCWQQSDQFCLFDHPIRDLHGATLGVIGSGSLGSGVIRLAEAFGMRVLRAEHKGVLTLRLGYTAFDEVLREADAITLHCPLNEQTQSLIGEVELRAMKPSALLINTARGGLVDEAALIRALKEGWIAGAGFDVITTEPPPADHPMIAVDLLALPNFLLTPHVAWASRPAMQTLADQLIANIEAFVAGSPRSRVV
jgi:glycerate dehydrogenase